MAHCVLSLLSIIRMLFRNENELEKGQLKMKAEIIFSLSPLLSRNVCCRFVHVWSVGEGEYVSVLLLLVPSAIVSFFCCYRFPKHLSLQKRVRNNLLLLLLWVHLFETIIIIYFIISNPNHRTLFLATHTPVTTSPLFFFFSDRQMIMSLLWFFISFFYTFILKLIVRHRVHFVLASTTTNTKNSSTIAWIFLPLCVVYKTKIQVFNKLSSLLFIRVVVVRTTITKLIRV